jgi:hypothetical protein
MTNPQLPEALVKLIEEKFSTWDMDGDTDWCEPYQGKCKRLDTFKEGARFAFEHMIPLVRAAEQSKEILIDSLKEPERRAFWKLAKALASLNLGGDGE